MKRRILSLVLLVATVLTALPLTVLPAIAVEAEKPTYTEEDYNALYVKAGLVLAADFYRTNAYWGKEALANVKDYIWHAWQNSTDTKVTISAGGTVEGGAMTLPDTGDIVLSNVSVATKKGYNGATMEQVLDINTATMSGGEGFLFNDLRFHISVNKQENKITVDGIGLRDVTAGRIVTGLKVNIGCSGVTTLAFIEDRPTDTFTNYSYTYPDDVVKPTDAQMEGVTAREHFFYVTHTLDAKGDPVPRDKVTAVVYALNEPVFKTYNGLRYIIGYAKRSDTKNGEAGPFYHDVETDPGMIGLYANGEQIYYDDALAFPNNGTFSDSSFLLRSGRIDGKAYAVRHYDRVLSADELAENHVADLAKYYRLDIGYYRLLDAAGRAKVAEALAGYTVGGDATVKEALAAAFATASYEAALAQYEDALTVDLVEALGVYGLDAEEILRLPAGWMSNTYTFLQKLHDSALLPEGYATAEEAFRAALDADYEAYSQAGMLSEEAYNSLYVLDGLFYAIDFFSTNSLWGGSAIEDATTADINSFQYVSPTAGGTATGLLKGTPGVTIEDGYLVFASADSANYFQIVIKNVLAKDDYDLTVEKVMKFGTVLSGDQFFDRQFWFKTSGSNGGKDNATLTFTHIYDQVSSWGGSSDPRWGAFWKHIHLFSGSLPTYTVGNRAATLSFVWQIGDFIESPTTPAVSPNGTSAVTLYAPDLSDPIFAVKEMSGQILYSKDQYYSNGTYDTVADPGHYGFDTASLRDTWVDRIGYNKFDGRVYAVRYYDRALTQAETLQNHFADLAKFFRLNLEGLDLLSTSEKEALYRAVGEFDMATSNRREVQAAVSAFLTPALRAVKDAEYASYADAVSAADMAVLKTYGLDPAPIAKIPHGALSSTLLLLDDLAVNPDYLHATERYAAALTADLAAEAALGANTAEDYNALYVQEGLQYSADFFSTNEYWGGKSNLPQSPATDTAYLHTDGKTYDFTKVENRVAYWFLQQKKSDGNWYDVTEDVTYGGVTYSHQYGSYTEAYDSRTNVKTALGASDIRVSVKWTEPFAAAVKKLSTAMTGSDESKNLLLQYQNYSQGGYMQLYIPVAHADYDSNAGQYQIVPFAIENGYLRFNGWMQTENYLGISGLSTSTITDNVSQQLVTQPDNKLGSSGMMFWNTRINLASTVNGLQVTGFNNFKATAFPANKPTITLDGKAITLTHTLLDRTVAAGETATANAGSVMMRVGTTTLYELSGTFTAAASSHHLFGYGGGSNKTETKIYAIRMYTSELTNDEILQNHFADLAKFFRLNISGFSALSSAEKLEVYKAMRDLDLATSTREEVQEVYLNALKQIVLDRYADADIPAEFLELTANYNLDLTDLLTADRDMSKLYPAMMNKNLRGKSFAEVQEIYRDVYAAVYNYYSYAVDGQDAWNGYLDVLAEEKLEADGLMDLPFAMRQGAIGLDTQAALDAYVKDALSVVDLAGMQVRLETGLAETDMPGVRAVFTIDEKELLALVKQYGTVTFGVEIAVGGVAKKHLTFIATSDGNGKYVLVGLDGAKTRMIQTGESTEVLGFVYTVTYKNYNKGTEGYEAYYEKDFSYRTFLTVDEETPLTQDVWHPIFKGSVSAKEVYQHFLDHDAEYEYDFASDKILQAVLGSASAVTE